MSALRSPRERALARVSKDGPRASWFETREDALLTMRGLILPEHDRGHPAGHQRHESSDEPIGQAVLPGGGGDELFEADLDDLERGFGARHQRTVGEQFDLDIISADRHFA